jgi:hypothetical protein
MSQLRNLGLYQLFAGSAIDVRMSERFSRCSVHHFSGTEHKLYFHSVSPFNNPELHETDRSGNGYL